MPAKVAQVQYSLRALRGRRLRGAEPKVSGRSCALPLYCASYRGAACLWSWQSCLYLGRALAARQLAAHALEVFVLFYAAGVLLEDLADLEVRVYTRRGERDERAADEADRERGLAWIGLGLGLGLGSGLALGLGWVGVGVRIGVRIGVRSVGLPKRASER